MSIAQPHNRPPRRSWAEQLGGPDLVSFGMLAGALVSLLADADALPAWRFIGALAALLGLVLLNLLLLNFDHMALAGSPRRQLAFLLPSAALFLVAFQLGSSPSFSFIPFLIFLLVGQAVWGLPLRLALCYAAALLLGSLVLSWRSAGAHTLLPNALSWLAGTLFTVMFSLLARSYRGQTLHAQQLLEQLTRAGAELAEAREREKQLAVAEERVRVARDIHDGLGHHLTALHVQLQAAERLLARDPAQVAPILATCRAETQAALAEVRRSVAALRDGPLEGRTLEQALVALAHDFTRRGGAAARFRQHGQPRDLSAAAALTLYRAAQEGLTNIQKHAVARAALVDLRYEPDAVRLRVEDDGAGAPSASAGGFGLLGLRERAAQLGGVCRAGPLPQAGFALDLELPFHTQRGS